ncbi:MAG: T9SS type A sorting domain-containing protein [Ignavibacteriaceae bacterium]
MGVWSLGVSADTLGDTTIFAGAWSGVYSSTDRGENWKVTGLSTTAMPVHSIIIYKNFIFAASLSDGTFISQDNGLTWINIIIKNVDPFLPEMSAPIYSITAFAGPYFNYLIAGSIGGIYYMDYLPSSFEGDIALAKWDRPVLCFANRNDTLFTVQYGYFFKLFYRFITGLTHESLNIPFFGYKAVYSLALNNGYIFAGTDNGIWRLSYPVAITGVESSREAPAGFELEQNYPNPFNPTTTISYQLQTVSNVKLIVYDVLGRPVATMVNERQTAGRHLAKFDAGGLPSGVYFYRLQAGSLVRTKKMILLQ